MFLDIGDFAELIVVLRGKVNVLICLFCQTYQWSVPIIIHLILMLKIRVNLIKR